MLMYVLALPDGRRVRIDGIPIPDGAPAPGPVMTVDQVLAGSPEGKAMWVDHLTTAGLDPSSLGL